MTPDAGSPRARGGPRWSREQWEQRHAEGYEWEWANAQAMPEAQRRRAEERWAGPGPRGKHGRCGGDDWGGVHDFGGRRPRSRSRQRSADVVRAVLLGVLLVLISRHAATGDAKALDGFAYSLLVAESVSFIWWRRRPWVHWGVALTVNVLWFGIGYPGGPVPVPLLLGVFGVSSTRSFRASVIAAIGPVAVLVAAAVGGGEGGTTRALIVSGWTLLMLALGRMRQAMHERRVAWREWAAAQEREAEAVEQRDADEERMRIAREVHDVVSHNLAVIRVQASVALHLLDTDKRPEQAREALAAIKQSSADALADLRSTLDVLRNPDDGLGEPRTPGRTASLAGLDGLVANAEAAGLPVELTVRGAVEHLPAEVSLAGFRVVQEAITNVLRHAGPARAQVLVDNESSPGDLVVEVIDDGVGGPRTAPAANPGSGWTGGHGITGMRERVEALGGLFEAGPIAAGDGGFRVRAVLPVPPGEPGSVAGEPIETGASGHGAAR